MDNLRENREKILAEVLQLTSDICNQQISETQSRRLEEILAENREAQVAYRQYMSMHAELYWLEGSLSVANSSPLHSVEMVDPTDRPTNFLGTQTGKFDPPVGRSLLALAAMLLVGLGIGISYPRWFASAPAELVQVASDELQGQSSGPPTNGETVARITGSLNCRWNIPRNAEAVGYGSKLVSGQQLELVEGVAEITFENGACMILQAPALLNVSAADESVLHRGRVTTTCPAGAEGFRVNTAGLTVVDLGTEFGVMADDQGNTEVHVFQGLVEGHFRESENGPLKTLQWHTNETIRYDHSKNQVNSLDKPGAVFVRTLSASLGPIGGLLAGEDFDYPVGRLGGQNSGFGWGGPWEDMSIEGELPESNSVDAGSLRFGILSNSGNHAALKGDFNRIRRVLSTSFSGVFDTAGLIEDFDGARLIGRDGTTLYLSFLQKIDQVEQVFYGFELHRGDGNKNRVLCVGHGAAKGWKETGNRSPNKAAGVTGWAVTSESNGTGNSLLELGDLGSESTEVALFVLKITFGQDNQDTIEVFKNPASLWDEELCLPDVIGKGNFSFDRISIANFEGRKTFEVDSIRIGTSFSGVTRPRWQTESIGTGSSSTNQ